ncbi:CZB domain-containing protein [Thalassolituus sp. ST750PaO-4]|uniref:CZB domain-containing protein n=1 Tax=Thalassolituus sp. ST750PaO-4 TaxID=2742965 RepID=UPI000C3E09A2|nr:CZB domain-containing protein [Thalassolituus sp. ST750PaO-4]MCA6061395.1 CZB domain-containing protein [Thalassolituus sp. ST750PaO-4]PIQ40437.1 MAG: hypothetical protein COW58_05860 [Thalassolituus sp. CG17_big_fil_post_rev_8_21_14_2_50_53_8]
MNKNETLQQLRQARTGHLRWQAHAQSILSAPNHLDNISEKAPMNHTDCQFGQWYFGQMQALRHIPGYQQIDPLHERLHQLYREIFDIMLEKKSGTFSWLFGSDARHRQRCIDKARPVMDQLSATSKELLAAIDELQKTIEQMPEPA